MPQANVIKIKRSTGTTIPGSLAYGELAVTVGTGGTSGNFGGRLFVGDSTEPNGNPVVIGGQYFTSMLDHQPGVLTASSALIVDANKKLDELLVDNISLNGNTISTTDANGNLTIAPNGSGYTVFSGTKAIVVPVGTDAQRPTAIAGMIRYNSDSASFEGYSSNWSSLGGVKSVDGQTYITAELTVGAGDDTLRFYTNSALRMSIDTNSIDVDSTITTLNLASVQDASSTSTGSLVTLGGVGIAKSLYVGTNVVVTGYVEVSSLKNTGTLTLPTSTDTLVGRNTTDTLTNKTLTSPNLTTPAIGSGGFTIAGSVSGTTTIITSTAAGGTITIPAVASSDTVVLLAATQNLTNKTLTSPTLVTPILGVATATSINGLTITSTTGGTLTIANSKTLTVNNSLTFDGTDSSTVSFGAGGTVTYTSNKLSVFSATSSSELAGVISDETGYNNNTGLLVFNNSPTLITPTLGAATATSINGLTITSSSGTLTITNGKTLSVSNTLTFTGTDSSSVAFGAGGNVTYTSNNLSVFASTTSSQLAGIISDPTGSGSLVFANSPTLVTPTLGAALATSITATSGALTIGAASGNNSVFIKPTGTGVIDVTNTSSTFSRISGVAAPVFANDAVNKEYADAIASSLNVHGSVHLATTGAVSYTYVAGGTSLTINTIASNVITFSANHGLALNSQIKANATSNGLTSGTTYFVISIPDLNQVTVSTVPGGTVHTLTDGTSLSISVTANIGVGAQLTGTPNTLDGHDTFTSLEVGYRILVKDHTTAAYNGVYTITSVGTGSNGVWTRATDFDNSPTGEIRAGDYFFVSEGTINGSNGFVQTNDDVIIVGTTAITFAQFSGAGQITAGTGLTKSGNTLNVEGTLNRIDANADSIDISANYVGQASITTLGTITTGVWNGTTIAAIYGGTGQSTYTTGDLLYASATNTLSKLAIGAEGYFLYSNGTTVSWNNTLDGGTF